MGKKARKNVKRQVFEKRDKKDESLSPFSSIILKEKKEEENKDEKKNMVQREKKPYEIVQGYDPDASFADILSSFEATGNPYSAKKSARPEAKEDFAAIFSKWENRGKKSVSKGTYVKSTYKATKSFDEILDAYENPKEEKGRKAPEVVVEEEDDEVIEEVEKRVEELPQDTLFRTPDEDEERSPEASWSIYGDNDSFVRKTPVVEEVGKKEEFPKPDEEEKKSKYTPGKNFGEILSSYYAPKEKKEMKEKSERKAKKERPVVKTFEEMMLEKGDSYEKRAEYTISKLRTMLPQATLDLHGLTKEEGRGQVDAFINDCMENGIRKISIITGKGLHSEDGVSVIKEMVDEYLSSSDVVSEMGKAPANYGGSGAYWVILKKKR